MPSLPLPLSLPLLLFLLLPLSHACTCIPSTLPSIYHRRSTLYYVRAEITQSRIRHVSSGTLRLPQTRLYTARITAVYKGCPPSRKILLRSPWSGESCGVTLRKGRAYLLPVRRGPRPYVFLCDDVREAPMLTMQERRFLDTRQRCCAGKCVCGAGPGGRFCRKRLCVGAPPCREAVRCERNACACRGEWFDRKGEPACGALE